MHNIGIRIANLRQQKNLSQRALAEVAGISAAALSQIESGQTSPSVATLEKLADGLGLSMAAFFLDAGEQTDLEIFNLDDRPKVELSSGGSFVPLTALHQPTGFEPMLVQLAPGGSFDEEQYGIQSARAFVWMRRGSAEFEYDGTRYHLSETQSVFYDARKQHNWRNLSNQPCELLMIRSR